MQKTLLQCRCSKLINIVSFQILDMPIKNPSVSKQDQLILLESKIKTHIKNTDMWQRQQAHLHTPVFIHDHVSVFA